MKTLRIKSVNGDASFQDVVLKVHSIDFIPVVYLDLEQIGKINNEKTWKYEGFSIKEMKKQQCIKLSEFVETSKIDYKLYGIRFNDGVEEIVVRFYVDKGNKYSKDNDGFIQIKPSGVEVKTNSFIHTEYGHYLVLRITKKGVKDNAFIDFYASDDGGCIDKKGKQNIFCGRVIINPKEMMTFDGKYMANSNEVYIDVITPKDRNLQGPLIVFDDTKILFKTHSLCRGANSNRLKAGGNGDTPTGRATTWYNSKAHNGKYSYGNYGLIYLEGNSGEFLTATKNGRDGIAIHAGHTRGYFNKSLEDKGALMGTFGCIRVYNEEMKKLGEIYQELKKQGKVIYCYIEDYAGNIKDVYSYYGMNVYIKDKTRSKRINKQ